MIASPDRRQALEWFMRSLEGLIYLDCLLNQLLLLFFYLGGTYPNVQAVEVPIA